MKQGKDAQAGNGALESSKAVSFGANFLDEDFIAYGRRVTSHRKLLQSRGHLSVRESLAAIFGKDAAASEKAALWLRKELRQLLDLEKKGTAPVRRGAALSPLVIGDIAMTMIEAAPFKPGPNLICLLKELLDVGRHRKSLAKKRTPELEKALVLEAHYKLEGRQIGVRELARLVGVNASTVTAWRKSNQYKALVREATSRIRLIRDDEE